MVIWKIVEGREEWNEEGRKEGRKLGRKVDRKQGRNEGRQIEKEARKEGRLEVIKRGKQAKIQWFLIYRRLNDAKTIKAKAIEIF